MKTPQRIYSLFGLLALLALALPKAHGADPWLSDFESAQTQAQRENKRLILLFTGSDWCYYCKRLEAEVLATPQFQSLAHNCILVRLDFPKKRALPPKVTAQNAALQSRYKIDGFPTVIVVDTFGNEVKRFVGYDPAQGPEPYLAHLTPAVR